MKSTGNNSKSKKESDRRKISINQSNRENEHEYLWKTRWELGIELRDRIVFFPSFACCQDQSTLEDVFKVWREREQNVKTATIKWTEKKFLPKKHTKFFAKEKADTQPDLIHTREIEYLISGIKVCYEKKGMNYNSL